MDVQNQNTVDRENLNDAISYMSHLASSLLELQLIDETIIDEFLEDIKTLQHAHSQLPHDVIAQFFNQQTQLMGICKSHYGDRRLFINWLRYALLSHMRTYNRKLAKIENCVIEKAKLFFNHPHYLYYQNDSDRRLVQSEFLMALSEKTDDIRQNLAITSKKCLVLAPSYRSTKSLEENHHLDHKFCNRLELWGVEEEALPTYSEAFFLGGISYQFHMFGLVIKATGEQLLANTGEQLFSEFIFAGEDLITTAQSLARIDFPLEGNFSVWGYRYHKLFGLMRELATSLDDIHFKLDKRLSPELMQNIRHRPYILDVHIHELEKYLINQSKQPLAVKSALNQLSDYCQTKDIIPSQLLASELKRLDPLLDEAFVSFWQKIDGETSLSSDTASIKQKVLDRIDRLNAQLCEKSVLLTALIAIFSSSACGLKTAPRSNQQDLRPEIPYRSTATIENNVIKKEEKPNKPHDDSQKEP